MSRTLRLLLALPLAACSIEGTELLGRDPEPEVMVPEITDPTQMEPTPTVRGLLVRDETDKVIGHLVIDDATSGVFLYDGDIHPVRIAHTDGGLEVTGFQTVERRGALTIETERMLVVWTGEAGVGVGTILGSSTFCDIDFCNARERFTIDVATGPVDGVAAVEVALENGVIPSRFFPNDPLRIAFDRFFDVAHVRDHLEVSVNGERIAGEIRIAASAGRRVAAVVFEPDVPFTEWLEVTITLPGTAATVRRISEPSGALVDDGRVDMTHWSVPDGDGFTYEFACVRPERGPLLVLRSSANRVERAYTYVIAGTADFIEFDVLSGSNWTSTPAMARILVDGVPYYQHGGPSEIDGDACTATAGPGDYYETVSGGGALRIPIEGEPGQRVHITVEAWAPGVSPSSAIVVGLFAGR